MRGERLLVGVMAALAAGIALLIAGSVLDLVPHVTDSVSYLFQGRILASGALYAPPPALPMLFGHENVLLTATRWCSIYPPGWPLLLALGWLVHAPWLVSPLLLALAVVGVWLAGRRLYDAPTGLVAGAALACSPFALLMAGDAMAHVPALCATVWCLAEMAGASRRSSAALCRGGGSDLAAAAAAAEGAAAAAAAADIGAGRIAGPERAPAAGVRKHLVAAGLLGGFALLIRPLTAAALLAPAVIWCAIELARRRRQDGQLRAASPASAGAGRLEWLWIGLGAAPCLLALAAYDAAVFGGPFVTGYALYEPQRFAHAGGALEPAAVALLRNLPWYLRHLNGCLWGFPCGDLLLLVPLLWARPRRADDAVLAACAASLVLAHCFYFYGDVIYSGPRFAFESLGPLALLAARSLLTLRASLVSLLERMRGLSAGTRRTLRLALTGAGVCMLLVFPLGRRLPAQMLHHAQWYLAQSAAPLAAAARAGVGDEALVFVAGTPWCYSSFFLANDLHPATARRVYVRDFPPLRSAAMRLYPRHEVWVARVVVEIPDPRANPDVARPLELSWQRIR
ncbi:MAG TPA: hypothetical protein VHR45_11390 [Thermoanaerobaculia bacterium]|nr:hypothetical protein [Thermoanaerobaculia bacterium]